MLCERCNHNPVTVHMQQDINGEKSEVYLCSECAAEFQMPMTYENLFQGVLSAFFSQQGISDSNLKIPKVEGCPSCGLTFKDFQNTGQLGCSSCYTFFQKQLFSLLKNIQGSNTHHGKIPKKAVSEASNRRRIDMLRKLLDEAIAREEYEEAAKIRDTIKEIQNEQSKLAGNGGGNNE